MVGTLKVGAKTFTFDSANFGIERYLDTTVQAEPGTQAAAALKGKKPAA
jgi:hypothetical protein